MKSSFLGYVRPDGQVGVRNHLLVLSSVVCANAVTRRLENFMPGVVCVSHQHGCGHLGPDREQVARVLSGLGANPNVGACIVVGLGCENVPAAEIAGRVARSGKPVEHLNIQDQGGVEKCVQRAQELVREMSGHLSLQERTPASVRQLILATQCGGSDFTSGIGANPALGKVSDLLVSWGGTVILSETTEFIGAEHILKRRAESPRVSTEIDRIINAVEDEVRRTGTDLRVSQPSPGNMAGGLSTIEEKSLGCILKAGTSPIRHVVALGAPVVGPGVVIMDTPGHDVESLTAMAAGGAQLAAFTTGRGTPVGNPLMPVIKITANPHCARTMKDHIDLDISAIPGGRMSIEEGARKLLDLVMETASGQLTRAESGGHSEIAISRLHPSM